jgi:uncharacterized LabA/DUF88 family protein
MSPRPPRTPRPVPGPSYETGGRTELPLVEDEPLPDNGDRYRERSATAEPDTRTPRREGARSYAGESTSYAPPRAGTGAMFAHQRLAILADVSSLQRSAKKAFGRVVSFTKLLGNVVRGRAAVRAIAFVGERDAADGPLLDHLRQAGFEIRRAESSGPVAVEALRLAERVDAVVLAGSDPDFTALVQALRGRGCRAELAAFPEVTPEGFREIADTFHALGREELHG